MKRLTPTILALILTTIVSSSAFAGNIPGGRAAGHIAGGRAAGNIAGGRATVVDSSTRRLEVSREATSTFDFDTTLSGSLVGVIRMLLDAGALL